jgi:hypothetical protein
VETCRARTCKWKWQLLLDVQGMVLYVCSNFLHVSSKHPPHLPAPPPASTTPTQGTWGVRAAVDPAAKLGLYMMGMEINNAGTGSPTPPSLKSGTKLGAGGYSKM